MEYRTPMVGALPGSSFMTKSLTRFGYKMLTGPEGETCFAGMENRSPATSSIIPTAPTMGTAFPAPNGGKNGNVFIPRRLCWQGIRIFIWDAIQLLWNAFCRNVRNTGSTTTGNRKGSEDMEVLTDTIRNIRPADAQAAQRARQRWDSIAKPLRSLGKLETTVCQIAGILGTERVVLDKRCVVPMCADNGVVAQGVTQTGSEVTAIVAENFAKGDSSVCCMARCIHADVIPVDIGVARDLAVPGVWNRKIRYGTADMTQTAAMTREEAVRAVENWHSGGGRTEKTGLPYYRHWGNGDWQHNHQFRTGVAAAGSAGRAGDGLWSRPFQRRPYAQNWCNPQGDRSQPAGSRRPAVDMLSKVGGLDIAGMVGIYLGCAAYKIPVLIDGMISAVAALLAVRMAPLSRQAMLPSHVSKEPAGQILLDALGFEPLLTCDMCLGEGTGGIAALGLIDMALAVYHGMCTFDEAEIEPYQDLREQTCSH